jgi:UDP-glucuronate 4-epimerase
MTISHLNGALDRTKSESVTWLVTGAAGFIGMHTALRLIARGDKVIGLDNLNNYYDVSLKLARLSQLQSHANFSFCQQDLADCEGMANLFEQSTPQRVIHLAAQAGVRHSITHPHSYADSNLTGFVNVLEGCRNVGVKHLVYASSSSVYGGNTTLPFSEHHNIDHPVSLYAATKKANELMAHSYSHLYGVPTTGLRFFTVYGPWGRPDMALFLFANAILRNEPIDIFNHGNMVRDFTYIDDIVEAIIRVADKPATPNPAFDSAQPDPASSNAPYRVFNIGNSRPTPLMDYIHALEDALGTKAKKNYLSMQSGDVPATAASTDELFAWIGFRPNTSVAEGVGSFVKWYRQFYSI